MNKSTILTISVAALALVSCKEKHEEKTVVKSVDTAAVAVVTTQLKGTPWTDLANYSADLRGFEDAVLVTTAAGVVSTVAEVGRGVAAGQGLCDIESERYKVQFEAAKSAVDANKAAQDAAKGELDRTKANVDAGSLGKAALDGVKAQYAGLIAQGKGAEAQALAAKKQWDDSRCLAPFSGVVATRMINRWESVGPGTPTLRLVRNDRLEANFTVPENEARELKVGVPVEFYQLDEPNQVYKGNVSSVDLAADVRNRTIGAKVIVSNVGGKLRPGMVGRARLLRKKYTSAVVVSSAALLRQENGVRAAIVKDGKASLVEVELGSAQGDSVLVRSGLKVGDKLIVQGAFRVSEGTRVKE
ncbi:MAG: efflux RND transporter periplasmic adaptor subunit [Fibrobacterota bacterium]